ncbi:inositol-trisphosphate 3-kinase A [Platysternon megacephalum]|uniref:Inositol-trisphosphate 3-kinase A n=1 Tax=Platysternon megacephalum TaxID=55544 RepID=A0A4D9F0C4_9SAUR|nr:inositol-trisphosphate 3-kinase A [Platysternon megacephalum]
MALNQSTPSSRLKHPRSSLQACTKHTRASGMSQIWQSIIMTMSCELPRDLLQWGLHEPHGLGTPALALCTSYFIKVRCTARQTAGLLSDVCWDGGGKGEGRGLLQTTALSPMDVSSAAGNSVAEDEAPKITPTL